MDLHAKIKTVFALGLSNVARVAAYRLRLRWGLHPSTHIKAKVARGPFFGKPEGHPPKTALARQAWTSGSREYFGKNQPGSPANDDLPDWFLNPWRPGARADSTSPWWEIPDFVEQLGDIKTVWELSRFDWVLAMAQRAAVGDESELERLNIWLADWAAQNPPYTGANWKCGQEASIRVIHLLTAALILGQSKAPQSGLRDLVAAHLKRIAPTIDYAIGQANNHGTSEAVALFAGGCWLGGKDGKRWARLGLRWLENRAKVLIEPDGSFSQYSVNYHRLMLDTYCFAEIWRRHLGQPKFSELFYTRLAAATDWLTHMTQSNTGGAPNLGANDGAQIFKLSDSDYRDFRPSVQLAGAVFLGKRVFEAAGAWDQGFAWMGLEKSTQPLPPLTSQSFDNGGLHVLRQGKAVVYLRYPRFRFRPSQADALHCDFWLDGENIMGDAGTYSYNISVEDTAYFNGTASHNTICFNGQDQMPRLSRFLFGDWLQALNVSFGQNKASAAYQDKAGNYHSRQLELTENALIVRDEIRLARPTATLRWRLPPGNWHLDGNELRGEKVTLQISANMPISDMRLGMGSQSLYYLEKTEVPVFEIDAVQDGTIITKVSF